MTLTLSYLSESSSDERYSFTVLILILLVTPLASDSPGKQAARASFGAF